MQNENSRRPVPTLVLLQYSALFAGVLLALILAANILIRLSNLNESYFLNAVLVLVATYSVSWIVMRREARYFEGPELWLWATLSFLWMLAIDAAGFPGSTRKILDMDYPSNSFSVNFLLAALILALALIVSVRVTVKAWRR